MALNERIFADQIRADLPDPRHPRSIQNWLSDYNCGLGWFAYS